MDPTTSAQPTPSPSPFISAAPSHRAHIKAVALVALLLVGSWAIGALAADPTAPVAAESGPGYGLKHVITISAIVFFIMLTVVMLVQRWGSMQLATLKKRASDLLDKESDARELAEKELKQLKEKPAPVAAAGLPPAVHTSDDSVATTLNAIGDAVITTNAAGLITRMNPAAEDLTGWTFASAQNHSIREVFNIVHTETRRPAEIPVGDPAHKAQINDAANRAILITRTATERYIAASGAPVLDPTGNLQGIVVISRDLTAQHRLEQEVKRGQKLDYLGQIAGGVAFNFNNMLGGIIGYSEILLSRIPKDDKLRQYVEGILDTAQRAAGVSAKLLAFSRRDKIPAANMDLHQALTDALNALDDTIDRRIQVQRNLKAAPSIVIGDLSQLQEAILNLATNACHAMPQGGTLTCSTASITLDEAACRALPNAIAPGPYVELTVSDTGTGMSKETIDKLFEPFFTTRHVDDAAGLGLPAVYNIIKDHRGTISVTSEPGKGSTFRLVLPVSPNAAAIQKPATPTQVARGSGRILLVDDEKVIRHVGLQILADMGYEVNTAETGMDAVAYATAHPNQIDLVILDLVMPTMSGRETLVELKKVYPGIKVILSSGLSLDSDLKAFIEKEGAVGFVQKPYRVIPLSHQIADIIRRV